MERGKSRALFSGTDRQVRHSKPRNIRVIPVRWRNILSDLLKTFYEEWHLSAGTNRTNELRDRDIMALNYLNDCESICELGVGSGMLLNMSNASYKAGVDISKEAIKNAKESMENTVDKLDLKVLDIDAEDLPWKEESFDGVMAVEVLEHLFDPVHALSEMNRVLKQERRIVITVPNIGYYYFRWYHLKSGEMSDFHGNGLIVNEHIRFYGVKSIKKLLELTGFEIINVKGAMKRIVKPQGVSAKKPKNNMSDVKILLRHLKPTPTNVMAKVNWLFKLWKIFPSFFAAGLVVEAVKKTNSEYKYNSAIDHQLRTLGDEELNINSVG